MYKAPVKLSPPTNQHQNFGFITVLVITLLSCLRSDIVILDTLIVFTYLLTLPNFYKPDALPDTQPTVSQF